MVFDPERTIEVPSWDVGLSESRAGRCEDLVYDDPKRPDTGGPRFCGHCQKRMEGPDACLGLIPGVSHACCGHGDSHYAYVVIGGSPGEPVGEKPNRISIYGERAVRFFELIKEHST